MLIDCSDDRPPGLMIVLVGPSGTGKTSMAGVILRDFSDAVRFVTSTTRSPRPGEEAGRDYHFLSREEFEARVDADEFLEWQETYGNLYGTSRVELERLVATHAIVLAVLDIRGAFVVREAFGELALLVGLWSEREDLLVRLIERGDGAERAERRLRDYDREMAALGSCDVCLYNPDGGFKECSEALVAILRRRLSLGRR